MNPEEIKVGEIYDARMLITRKNDTDFRAIPMTKPCVHCAVEHVFAFDEIAAFSPISPAPKYDPCRMFREGDIVEPCQVKGRWLSEAWKNRKGIHYKVTSGEDDECVMWVQDPDSLRIKRVEAVFFQLVTPVEELEPYSVHESDTINGFDIMREGLCVMTFPYGSKEAGYYRNKLAAKEAAEAERDRLNDEWRKEQV